MKILLQIATVLVAGFLMTGCMAHKVGYDRDFTEFNTKNDLNKIKNKEVAVSYVDGSIAKRTSGTFPVIPKTVLTNELNAEIMKDFVSQYFETVELNDSIKVKEKNYLQVNTSIKDFEFQIESHGGMALQIHLDVDVFLRGNLILSKIYYAERDGVKMAFGFDLFRSPRSWKEEQVHKNILDIYEKQFKPDLLKALKENI